MQLTRMQLTRMQLICMQLICMQLTRMQLTRMQLTPLIASVALCGAVQTIPNPIPPRARPSTMNPPPSCAWSAAEATSDTEYFDRPSPDGSGGRAGGGTSATSRRRSAHRFSFGSLGLRNSLGLQNSWMSRRNSAVRPLESKPAELGTPFTRKSRLSPSWHLQRGAPWPRHTPPSDCGKQNSAYPENSAPIPPPSLHHILCLSSARCETRKRIRLILDASRLPGCILPQQCPVQNGSQVERGGQGHGSLWRRCGDRRAGRWQKGRCIRTACGGGGAARWGRGAARWDRGGGDGASAAPTRAALHRSSTRPIAGFIQS